MMDMLVRPQCSSNVLFYYATRSQDVLFSAVCIRILEKSSSSSSLVLNTRSIEVWAIDFNDFIWIIHATS
jgi:hypothetical protein